MTTHRLRWVLGGCAFALAATLAGLQSRWAAAGPPAPQAVRALSTPYVLQVEAETLPREWPMQTGYAADASACLYVYSPIQESGLVTYTLDLPQGAFYIFWGRAMGLGEQQNSLYYALDGGEWAVWAIPAGEGGRWTWTWSRVGSPVWLDAGSHTLAFRGREHDTRLDRLEVTTDVAYQPSTIEPCGQPPWTPTPTQTATPTPTPTLTPTPAIQWFVEAEEGGLVWPMQAHWDEEASACLYVGSDTRDAGAVSFGFDITEADFYFVHARAMGLGWDQNSFWVSVDDGPEHIWEIEPGEGGTWTWVWDAVTSLALNPGPHVLTLRAREAGARVDRLEFASRADLPRSILPCGATGTPSPTPTATSPAPSTPTATATPTRTATPSPTVPAGWMRRAYLPLVPVEQGGGVR